VAFENLLVARDGAVETVTINRPKALNTLNPATVSDLLDYCATVRQDRTLRCLVLTGAGERAFVAGADIAAMATMSPLEGYAFARLGQRLMHELEELPIPVIAAVNGFALGGGLELALACDFIVASATAKFGQPEINLGIIPGFGGTQRLARCIGVSAARALIYTGDVIRAEEAQRLGLVHRVVPAGELSAEAQKLAATLASKAPVALQRAKAAINVGADVDLQAGCRYEAEAFAATLSSDDRTEGMRAFLEKRPAAFKGH
jgi:enoyl-CoA hydratase